MFGAEMIIAEPERAMTFFLVFFFSLSLAFHWAMFFCSVRRFKNGESSDLNALGARNTHNAQHAKKQSLPKMLCVCVCVRFVFFVVVGDFAKLEICYIC